MPIRAGQELLKHAFEFCSDNDCELHNPEVGVENGTVLPTNVAFYVAGMYAGAAMAAEEALHAEENFHDELVNRGLVEPVKLPPGELDPRD